RPRLARPGARLLQRPSLPDTVVHRDRARVRAMARRPTVGRSRTAPLACGAGALRMGGAGAADFGRGARRRRGPGACRSTRREGATAWRRASGVTPGVGAGVSLAGAPDRSGPPADGRTGAADPAAG